MKCYRCGEWDGERCSCKDGQTIFHGDCREILPELPKVDLVLTDPPYFGVLSDSWDNQWKSEQEFIDWSRLLYLQFTETIKSNGTLYWFCSPQLHDRLSVLCREFFNVIASAVWSKGELRKGAAGSGVDITALRTYWTANTERCIIAEQYGQDVKAASDSGYWEACDGARQSVFGEYFRSEFEKAGVKNREIAELFPSRTGGLTGCVSNWIGGANVPTEDQYNRIREHLNKSGSDCYLRREYEELRREYEELRREYEELRRPFNLDSLDQWGDVWNFPIERKRQHPAQKPLLLIGQLVKVSSRSGGIVLDPFMGSGTTLRACKDLGRRGIGIELEEKYCEIAAERLRQGVLC